MYVYQVSLLNSRPYFAISGIAMKLDIVAPHIKTVSRVQKSWPLVKVTANAFSKSAQVHNFHNWPHLSIHQSLVSHRIKCYSAQNEEAFP